MEPTNARAWTEFVDNYGPVILGWCSRWGLQTADAEDVTQNVLLRLARKLPDFEYDAKRSFRAWLKTLTHHALADAAAEKSPGTGSGDTRVQQMLDTVAARDDLADRLEAAYDRELANAAMEAVKARVAPQTWEAFRLTAIEGVSGADAAAQIPMQVAQVYVARRRVQKLLEEEIRALESAT